MKPLYLLLFILGAMPLLKAQKTRPEQLFVFNKSDKCCRNIDLYIPDFTKKTLDSIVEIKVKMKKSFMLNVNFIDLTTSSDTIFIATYTDEYIKSSSGYYPEVPCFNRDINYCSYGITSLGKHTIRFRKKDKMIYYTLYLR